MKMRVVLMGLALATSWVAGAASAQEKETSKSKDQSAGGRTGRGWLGVSVQDVTPRLARDRDLSVTAGAIINDVMEDGPAEKAGLREGDVIVRFNGAAIADADDLTDAVRTAAPASQAGVEIQRRNEKKTVTVTLGKAPRRTYSFTMPHIPPVPRMRALPRVPRIRVFTSHDVLGLSLADLNTQLGEYFDAPDGKGVLVEEVAHGSAGERAGFKAGDVIVRVGTERVGDTRDVLDALGDARAEEAVTIGILRKGAQKDLTVQADDISRSRSFRHHPEDCDEDEAAVPGIQKEEFKHQMDRLKEQLRSVGRHIRQQMEQLRQALRREYRSVAS